MTHICWEDDSTFPFAVALHQRHSQPRFTCKRLKSLQHPYPELQAKAHNAACHDTTLVCGVFV